MFKLGNQESFLVISCLKRSRVSIFCSYVVLLLVLVSELSTTYFKRQFWIAFSWYAIIINNEYCILILFFIFYFWLNRITGFSIHKSGRLNLNFLSTCERNFSGIQHSNWDQTSKHFIIMIDGKDNSKPIKILVNKLKVTAYKKNRV